MAVRRPRREDGTCDVSKLDQWQLVLPLAQSFGLFLHFKTQETENDDQRLTHERTPGRGWGEIRRRDGTVIRL